MILCFNTAGHTNTLVLIEENVLIAEKTWLSQRNETETLLPFLEILLKQAQKKITDLTGIHVIVGVGGFTSLRVGISIANTIAYVQKIPLYGSSVFELWKERVALRGQFDKDVAILIDAGRQECFYVSCHSGLFYSPNIIPNAHLAKLKEKFWVGEVNAKQKEILEQSHLSEITALKTPGEAFAEMTKKILLDKREDKLHQTLEPWYGREPNISKAKSLL